MTLCVAWKRLVDRQEELIFATDSCLSGGERWHHGIKLFELPRKDSVICFTGDTRRAYPLIHNLLGHVQFDSILNDKNTDISIIVEHVVILFTNLVKNIFDQAELGSQKDIDELSFLFGGWSWKEKEFVLWKIYFSKDVDGFVHNRIDIKEPFFIGDADAVSDAINKLEKEISVDEGVLDMQPLKVLIAIAQDDNFDNVGGALQIMKVYPSGISEPFGILWPSEENDPHLFGLKHEWHKLNNVKVYNPESLSVIDEVLPKKISADDFKSFGIYQNILERCYDEDLKLRNSIERADKHILQMLFRKRAYELFIMDRSEES